MEFGKSAVTEIWLSSKCLNEENTPYFVIQVNCAWGKDVIPFLLQFEEQSEKEYGQNHLD